MNTSVITNAPEYDYRFLVYLLDDVFGKKTLAQCSVYKSTQKQRKFNDLDEIKFAFVKGKERFGISLELHEIFYIIFFIEDIFKERVGSNKQRWDGLATLINKRCQILRTQFKSK